LVAVVGKHNVGARGQQVEDRRGSGHAGGERNGDAVFETPEDIFERLPNRRRIVARIGAVTAEDEVRGQRGRHLERSATEQRVSRSLAEAVRRFRAARSWTLDDLAARSGVSRRLVVQIEQGDANPSIGTLLRLADALEVTLTDLVSDHETTFGVRAASEATELWQEPAGGRALLEVSRGPLELWSWTLGPGESHLSDAHHPGALELVKVRRGTLVLEVADESVQVKAGHSAWFDASRQHAYRNTTTTPVTFTLVVFDSADRTTELT
jgi:transcriptional regulator with XRE-family HTH domain